MNGDYLWNKTGHDPEIEKLENQLQVFRLRTSATPVFEAKLVPTAEEPRRRRFVSLGFAFAATLAIVTILFSVWMLIPKRIVPTGNEFAGTGPAKLEIEIPNPARAAERSDPVIKPLEKPVVQRASDAEPVRLRFIRAEMLRRKAGPQSKFENPKSTIALTMEEKYAYNQLMLALSITSSKLKLVRDKVESPVYQENSDDKGRRN